jgi:multidrug efflux pump subunit AcrA (membrane-fusion protein)
MAAAHEGTPRIAPQRDLKVPGRVEAAAQVHLYARLAGFVRSVQVDIGDRVRQGQLLAELALPEIEADLNQKKALLAQADAEAQHARQVLREATATLALGAADVRLAEAAVRHAKAKLSLAQASHDRLKKLFDDKAIDQQLVDEKAHQLEAAKAGVEEAESKLAAARASAGVAAANRDTVEAGVKVAEARRQAARAEVDKVAVQLHYGKINAPFDGVISQRTATIGELAGPPAARGQPLFTVTRMDMVRVVVAVPEMAAAQIQAGANATVEIGALPGSTFKGKIARTAWVLDPQKHTLRAEIDLANPEGKLMPGMSANVTIRVGKD